MFPITLLQYFCNSRRNEVDTFRRTPPRGLEGEKDADRVADWPDDNGGGSGGVDRGIVIYNLGDSGQYSIPLLSLLFIMLKCLDISLPDKKISCPCQIWTSVSYMKLPSNEFRQQGGACIRDDRHDDILHASAKIESCYLCVLHQYS